MRKILNTAGRLLACALLLAATPALAQGPQTPQPQAGHFGFVLGGALEFGGNDVATVTFTNGDEQDVKAGQGVSVDVGAHYRFAGSPVSIRGTIGYKYVTTQAENADINMSRVPLQLIGSWHFENGARFGAGVVRHNSVRFDGDGIGPDIDFEDATGFTVELGWKWFLLSYTGMDYEDDVGNEYSADNVGVKLIAEF